MVATLTRPARPTVPTADMVGRNIDPGLPAVGPATVVGVTRPTDEFPDGAVTLRNVYRHVSVVNLAALRERLATGAAVWLTGPLPDATRWRFPTRAGNRWCDLVRGDPLFCTRSQTRVRFHRMVYCGAAPAVPSGWMVEVTSNHDGRVLPDLRHPVQVFAYGA